MARSYAVDSTARFGFSVTIKIKYKTINRSGKLRHSNTPIDPNTHLSHSRHTHTPALCPSTSHRALAIRPLNNDQFQFTLSSTTRYKRAVVSVQRLSGFKSTFWQMKDVCAHRTTRETNSHSAPIDPVNMLFNSNSFYSNALIWLRIMMVAQQFL